MKKLFVTKLDRPHEETEHCADVCVGVYLASDVDTNAIVLAVKERDELRARISKLEIEHAWAIGQHKQALARIAELEQSIATLSRSNTRLRQRVNRSAELLQRAIDTALSSSGICLACGGMDDAHESDCWVMQARELMERSSHG